MQSETGKPEETFEELETSEDSSEKEEAGQNPGDCESSDMESESDSASDSDPGSEAPMYPEEETDPSLDHSESSGKDNDPDLPDHSEAPVFTDEDTSPASMNEEGGNSISEGALNMDPGSEDESEKEAYAAEENGESRDAPPNESEEFRIVINPEDESESAEDDNDKSGTSDASCHANKKPELEEALKMLAEAEQKVQSVENRLYRLGAEFENYRKRTMRQREEDRKYSNEKILKALLPVIDNMERAISAAENTGDSQLLSGVEMVHRNMLDTLKSFGLIQFGSLKEEFNPEIHEAMQQVETDEEKPGIIVNEYMKGYKLNERLLRPSMVAVAAEPKSGPDDNNDPEAASDHEEDSPDKTGGADSQPSTDNDTEKID